MILPLANNSLSNAVWWALFVDDVRDGGIQWLMIDEEEFIVAKGVVDVCKPVDTCAVCCRTGEPVPASLELFAFVFNNELFLVRFVEFELLLIVSFWLNRCWGDCEAGNELVLFTEFDDGGGELDACDAIAEPSKLVILLTADVVERAADANEDGKLFEMVSEIVRLRFIVIGGGWIFWLQCRLPQ